MRSLCVLVFFVAFFGCTLSDRPSDEIKVVAFNRSFYIANETYTFVLIPQFQVPLQVRRHIIYTSTTQTVTDSINRALTGNKKRGIELAQEDYELLSSLLEKELPSYVKVNAKKRSVMTEGGVRYVPLGKDAAVLFMDEVVSEKRGVPLGTAACYHIPFVTTCANSGDLDAIKKTLAAQVGAFRTELDSYKRTNDARASEMARVLNKQRSLIQAFAQEAGQTATLIDYVSSAAASNAAAQAHGDYVAHAQINYLKRVTNSLLRFSNALVSTDPRTVVAQPSMSKLFVGFQMVIDYLGRLDPPTNKTVVYQPILDTRVFNWTETPLPVDVVKNRVDVPYPFVDMDTLIRNLAGFYAVTTSYCSVEPPAGTQNFRCNNGSSVFPKRGSIALRSRGLETGDNWILGPFHEAHLGMYPVVVQNPTSSSATVAYFNVTWGDGLTANGYKPAIDDNTTLVTQIYCIDFLGYKVLSTFNYTPNMLNGLAAPTVSPLTDCANYLFKQDTISNPANYTKFLFGKKEGVVVPFYSNCDPDKIYVDTQINVSWLINYPVMSSSPRFSVAQNRLSSPYRVNAEHWISPNCYINIEPEWLDMTYWFPSTPTVISNIPRGYKLNQFTVNPAGELASSLEFVYTKDWAWVYQILRTSNNTVIVDEVDALDSSLVLFHLNGANVVDESDSFYGQSNNGRDCIRYAPTYEYDLTSCFFQNDENSYPVDKYLLGNIRTTGIARYTNKFSFGLNTWNTTRAGSPFSSYQVTLKPKDTADFSYTIDYQGSICPKLVSSTSSLSSCTYQFFYTGSAAVAFGTDLTAATTVTFDSSSHLSNPVVVSFQQAGGQPISNFLFANSEKCLLIGCTYTGTGSNTQSSVAIQKQKLEIVYASDRALNNSVDFVLGQTADSVRQLDSIKDAVDQAKANLSIIQDKLGGLDFNVSKIVPYEDFSALRAKADALINSLSPAGSRACANGVFGSIGCWLEDALSTLIVIGVLIAIGVGVYCLCIKFNLISKFCPKTAEF